MGACGTILHADLDAFYASVEQLLDPSLRGKPIAVGGGVVLAASYEARAFGVRGGMPGRKARELCPDLVFVDGHFHDYQRLGDAAIAVLSDFTPLVERISIDEAFADVAGTAHLFGPPEAIARTIRARVRGEVGLPISVGVARTKHLAKIASQVAKPDGLCVIPPETELEFVKRYLVRSHAFEIDTARKRVHQRLEEILYDLPEGYHDTYLQRVEAVTLEAANAAVQRRISEDDLVVGVVGTHAELGAAIGDAIAGLKETTVEPYDLE